MSMSATARAQAVQMLDEHVRALKRVDRAIKDAIRTGRQAQAVVTGITITTQPPGGTVDHADEDAADIAQA